MIHLVFRGVIHWILNWTHFETPIAMEEPKKERRGRGPEERSKMFPETLKGLKH